ncbi:MAG: lipase maturation factor family protein [Bacteriovoracaceae bacterium]
MEDFLLAENMVFVRSLFTRSLAVLYFVGFANAFNQFPALLGENGFEPVPLWTRQLQWKNSPSLFFWKYSDNLLKGLSAFGMVASLFLAIFGTTSLILHMVLWLLMYGIYLSIVNVGQTFYSFGWESMLLEAGFFAAFLGPEKSVPVWIPIIILRWMLFRTELGAGLIKLRGDPCWRDLTCLYWHHETQPMPNPLSRFFHHGPKLIHRWGVIFSHFVQLVVPFFIFFPSPVSDVAGAFIILHQLILVISGNYSWLNWLTIVLGFLCFTDPVATVAGPPADWFFFGMIPFGIWVLILSIEPAKNLWAKRQKMNYCWNRWHLVGAYGAFGSVTKERYEIVVEGEKNGEWREYEFKGKPGRLDRVPGVFAPYHLRLDWLMWFLPFSVRVSENKISLWGYEPWFINFVVKLLMADRKTLKLLAHDPWQGEKPTRIRAKFYQYHFTPSKDPNVWRRRYIDEYLPPLALTDLEQLLQR